MPSAHAGVKMLHAIHARPRIADGSCARMSASLFWRHESPSRHSCQVVIRTTLLRPVDRFHASSMHQSHGERRSEATVLPGQEELGLQDQQMERSSWRRRCSPVLRFGSEFAVHCKRPRSHPVHQAFHVPARLARGGLYSFRRFRRACAAFACLVVAFIALLPTLLFTFLALVGAVWIKQFF